MGTGSLSRGVKRTGRGVNHAPPSSAKVKERVDLYLYYAPGPSWPLIGRTLSSLYVNIMARQKFNGRDEGTLRNKGKCVVYVNNNNNVIVNYIIKKLSSYKTRRRMGSGTRWSLVVSVTNRLLTSG